MKKNKKQRRIMFLLILILGITIGFALLSTTLKINGTAGIKSNAWNIHWDDTSIAVTQGSVTATVAPTVSKTTNNKDTVSFEINLELPGEFYEFTIDAINEGTIDGELEVITTKIYNSNNQELTGNNIPSYLKYSIKYGDGSEPTVGDVLTANGGTQPYKIRVEYDSRETAPKSDDETYIVKIEVPYVQHRGSNPSGGDEEDEFGCTVDAGDDVTYYAPEINPTTTFDPTWTVYAVDNRTKGEKKACFVYGNQTVGLTAHQWDCVFNSTYTGCSNDDSYVSKGVRKGQELFGADLETYLFAGGYNMQIYNSSNSYYGFYINDNLVGVSTPDGKCEHRGSTDTLMCEVH